MKFTVLFGIFSVVLLMSVVASQNVKRSTEFANHLEAKLKTEFELVINQFFTFVKQLVVNITDDSGITTSATEVPTAETESPGDGGEQPMPSD